MKKEGKKPWAGRFREPLAKSAEEFSSSIHFDFRLFKQDIVQNIAYARSLFKARVLSGLECKKIIKALEEILKEFKAGKIKLKPELEDVHMNIETILIDKVGDMGKKLHSGRSRNDQVATDMRMYLKYETTEIIGLIKKLQTTIVNLAEENLKVIVPGYTHMQRAQPILFAHHLMAYYEMLERDRYRFIFAGQEADVMPLGSGALAGTNFDIDREGLAKELGFSQISRNSMDAVSDRDFVLECEAAASICMMHLSRLAEEIVLWSSAEFGFIELDDAYTTGSSIMPQKKNPDVAELARGKTGRVYGHLMALLTTMKGLPLAYNRDMQEDKEGFFDTVDTLQSTLGVFAGMVKTLKVNPENTRKAAERGYILATDLADYLVKNGETFRTAHEIVGKLVNYAAGKGKTFAELNINEYKKFSPLFGADVLLITIESSLAARDVVGGTAPKQVKKALARARRLIADK